jgi:hypothetical protein
MLARGFLSLHRAALSASFKNSANSNYSRTYPTPQGEGNTGLLVRPFPQLLCFPCLRKNRGVRGMSKQNSFLPSRLFRPLKQCRRADICSLFSPNPHSRLSFLSITCALFHFPYHTHPLSLQYLPHSFPKNPGVPHSGHTNASDGPSFSLRNLYSVFRLSVLCVSAVSPSSLYSPLPSLAIHFRGQTNVTAAGGRSVLQRCFSLRGEAASIAASKSCALSKGREMRKRSARRAWAYFS